MKEREREVVCVSERVNEREREQKENNRQTKRKQKLEQCPQTPQTHTNKRVNKFSCLSIRLKLIKSCVLFSNVFAFLKLCSFKL